jgi:hypothetical protein
LLTGDGSTLGIARGLHQRDFRGYFDGFFRVAGCELQVDALRGADGDLNTGCRFRAEASLAGRHFVNAERQFRCGVVPVVISAHLAHQVGIETRDRNLGARD